MLKADIGEILGLMVFAGDVYFLIKHYVLHYNESSSMVKNLSLFILMIVLMISSGMSVGAGLDLKGTLNALAQGMLGTSSMQSLLHRAAVLNIYLNVTLTLQVICSVLMFVLFRSIQKELKNRSQKYEKHWDLDKYMNK